MPATSPSVSVIIPAYNQAHFLAQAVRSVLEQSFADFEVIIVNDGSTDGTARVALALVGEKVRYIDQPNLGLAGARNSGIAAARGELVAFLDSDDYFLPGKLQAQVTVLAEHPEVGLAAGGWIYVDRQGAYLKTERPWEGFPSLDLPTLVKACPFIVSSLLVRKSWLDCVGGFDREFRRVEDWDLWLRLAAAGCKMIWSKEVVSAYRLHGANMTGDAVKQKEQYLKLLDKFYATPDLPETVARMKPDSYAGALLDGAMREFSGGFVAEGRADLLTAVECSPRLLENRGEELLNHFTAAACSPLSREPFAFLTSLFDQLPPQWKELRARRREAEAQAAMSLFFRAHERRDGPAVRRLLWKAVTRQPKWLLNRGVWSIAAQSILGRSASGGDDF